MKQGFETTRRQHYVWRKYLEPWTADGKLWCLRTGNIAPFHTNPINVAVERDFYKLHPLEPNDLEFIRRVSIQPIKNDTLRELNEGWLQQFKLLTALVELVRKNDKLSSAFQSDVDGLLIELEEKTQMRLEHGVSTYLDQLLAGDTSFFENDKSATEFCVFVAYQYFRTKARKEAVLNQFDGKDQVLMRRCWPVLMHVFATNVGHSIFVRRKTERLVLISNESSVEFITGDQPVLNTYAAHVSPLDGVEKVEFYYPISPTKAVIFTDSNVHLASETAGIGSFRATYFNQLVERCSNELLFARHRAALPERSL